MPKGFESPHDPKCATTENSYLILKYAHDTAESLLETFREVRRARSARGTPTDEEQDLLRAMVVLAGAGLDSMTKQLIREALPVMVDMLPAARDRIEKLGTRHLRRGGVESGYDDGTVQQTINPQRLARVLLAESTRAGMVELLIDDLTAGSLQSVEELDRIAGYFGLKVASLGVTREELAEVFRCRNQVIHEMDIDFSQPNRNRFPRAIKDMVGFTGTLLQASNKILNGVAEQLTD